ncbi:MAG: ARC6/PARC6 family protein [Leptolyngbyaceae cyanobacterium bins.349]|nr:ARC6/PARC6 family protein [Leptolyngbyaceae cyanobacterium bins.349]
MALRRALIWTLGGLLGVGALPTQAQMANRAVKPLMAQTSSPPPTPGTTPATTKGNTFYDRYMLAGYAATNRRDHATALVYFKRALDERPEDSYATQAIRNVEGYLGLSTPAGAQAPVTVTVPPVAASPAANTATPPPPATKPAPQKPASAATNSPQAPIAKPSTPKPTTAKPATPKPATPKPTTTQPTTTKPTTTQPTTAKPTTAKPTTAKPATHTNSAPTPPTKLAPPKTLPTAPTPAPTAKAPTAVVVIPSAPTSDAFNEPQAVALINRWLQAKADVFAPPYDQQPIADLTTGELLASLVRPNGVLNWLKTNRAYFRYGVQKVDSVERFVVARDRATMEINLTEDRTLYLNGVIDPGRTDFSSQRVRFTFGLDNGTWKIADYKTVKGHLLERSILSPNSSAVQ